MRVRDEVAKRNPMKNKGENENRGNNSGKAVGSAVEEPANPITRTGPRVPPEPHRAENPAKHR